MTRPNLKPGDKITVERHPIYSSSHVPSYRVSEKTVLDVRTTSRGTVTVRLSGNKYRRHQLGGDETRGYWLTGEKTRYLILN